MAFPPSRAARSRTPLSPLPLPGPRFDSVSGLVTSSSSRSFTTTILTRTGLGTGVTQHVGERLLQNPIALTRHRAGDQVQWPGHLHVEFGAGDAGRFQQPVGLDQSRMNSGGHVRLAEHAQDSFQIVERVTSDLLDGGECPCRELRVARRPCRPRLQDGDGQCVSDRVVEFARYPVPLQELLGALFQCCHPLGR